MNQCSISERRLEVLRAACVGQPREMVNLFFGPMRGLSTSERIEKALERLSERYGVPGGLTAEPAIVDIRNGSRVLHNIVSLKKFGEDLNTLEVFAYAHNDIEKLSGQLLLDVANRLPGVLKRRYLDYLNHLGLDLNKPGFDSLRNFVRQELKIMTSDMNMPRRFSSKTKILVNLVIVETQYTFVSLLFKVTMLKVKLC